MACFDSKCALNYEPGKDEAVSPR